MPTGPGYEWANSIRRIGLAGFIALGVLWVIAVFLAPPKHPSVPFNGHIVFLPPGTAPTFQDCLSALGPASSQEEPLTTIIPGWQADLCSSGSGGDIAYLHVTRSGQSGLTMNITIWEYLP